MAYFEVNKKPPLSFPTLTGSIVTFNSQYAGLPLKSHKIALTATQSGSGTPSPQNIRSINGYSAIHIGNISDNTNISYFQGLLNGTYGFVDLGSLEWEYSSDTFYSSGIASTVKEVSISSVANVICAKYTTTTARTLSDKCIAIGYLFVANGINIKDSDYTDAATFKNSLNGVYLIYELATPTTPSFTSAEFEALCEAFGMNGQYVEIQIGSTVYGGEYDAKTGVLTVTHQYFEFDGSVDENWSIIGSGDARRFGYNIGVSMADASSAITNYLSYLYGNRGSWGTFAIANNTYIICHDNQSNFSTLGDFTTYLSNNNLQLVAKLTTPTTIQLPPCPIDTLLENNIWADTGDTTLQYPKFG